MDLSYLGHNVADYPPGTKLICYERCSTRTDQSLASQEAAMRRFADERSFVIVRTYGDEGLSGSSTNKRPQFQEMLADARRKPRIADVLLLWDYSRFARDITQAQFYLAELRMLGWEIQSMNDRIPRDEFALIVEAVIHYKNQRYLNDVSTNTSRGMHYLAEQGYLPNSTPLPGYKSTLVDMDPPEFRNGEPRKARKVGVDETTAHHVRKAFEMKAEGATQLQILAESDIFGGEYMAARRWGYQTKNPGLERIFRNTAYIGQFVFSGQTYPLVYPRLIDDDLWQSVQAIRLKNKEGISVDLLTLHPRRLASAFWLSGRARCATCATPLYGSKGGRKPDYYNYYRCKGCVPNWQIPAEQLEAAILKQLLGTIVQPQLIADLSNWTTQQLVPDTAGPVDEYESAQAFLVQLLQKQGTIERNMAFVELDGSGLVEIYNEHRRKVKYQQALVEQLARETANRRVRCTTQDITRYLADTQSVLAEAVSGDTDHSYLVGAVLDKMVSNITVHRSGECCIYVHLLEDWIGR